MTRVLLIDDERLVRTTLGTALRNAGHEVLLAADGNEGLSLFESEGADIVVTDIIMPDKEGIETIMQLRRSSPGLPIIAISGGGRTSNFEFLGLAERLGATRTLKKPFRSRELLDLIEECMAERPPS